MKLMDTIRKSTKRSDLLVVEMTTEGTVRGGYLDQRMDYAKRLLDGDVEQENFRFLPIIFEQDSEQEILEVEIYSISGNCIYRSFDNCNVISLAGMEKGIYLLNAYLDNDVIATHKIVRN